MGLRVAELETLFTANIKDFEKGAAKVDVTTRVLAKSDPTVKVKADATSALADIGRVQDNANKIDVTTAIAKLDADASKAKAGVGEAEAALARIDGDTATLKVDADTSSAKADIGSLGGEGVKAGKDAGEGLSKGIITALVALPVAGSVVGAGVAIGKAMMDGLQVEVRSDRLMAQTGLDPKTVGALARASGEAYGNNWGESIAANMDTARIAIQGGLLDPKKAAEDSQAIIESLSGVADIIGEDIARVSRSTAQLLRTGLAKDAAGAFDLLVKGTQAGLNVSEDMLDTVDEYSTQFRVLGLEGPQAFGLLSQAVKGGARDTDTAADALKEFAIRAVDGSTTTAAGFKAIGVNAKTMADDITAGGPRAEAALGLVLDKLRAVKDPTDRAAAAVGLFGTKAEDMGDALYSMDLSTAVKQLGNVEGAAKSALDTLGDNTAGILSSAQRNIEVAADGIKGALATAFAPQIKGFATFVTTNRAAVMQFLLDMANGAIDAGRALANAAADGTEGFGEMVGYVGPAILGMVGGIIDGFARVANIVDPLGLLPITRSVNNAKEDFDKFRAGAETGFASVKAGSQTVSDAIRNDLIANGLDPAQEKLKAIAIPLVVQAKMHDMAMKLAAEIDRVKQGKVPSIDLNTKAGRAKLAAMERELAAMKDKTVTLTTVHMTIASSGKNKDLFKDDGGFVQAAADGARIEAASNGLRLAAGGHIPPPPGCRTGTRVGRPDVAKVTT